MWVVIAQTGQEQSLLRNVVNDADIVKRKEFLRTIGYKPQVHKRFIDGLQGATPHPRG